MGWYTVVMHKFIFKLSSLSLIILALVAYNASFAIAAPPASKTASLLGIDISWPQCGKTVPTNQAFAIVGVNGGLANNSNPCFATQLAWANASKGGTKQPLVQLYVNTANPGKAGSWWPTSNTYGDAPVSNPYGTCTPGDYGAACAYMYGYAKAYDDVKDRGVSNPASYVWWLDVEIENSWQLDKQANRADLEGMTAYFQSIGAAVGIYSTSYQWNQIVGVVGAGSNLNNLRSWIPGARSETAAKSNCNAARLTTNSPVVMTQFVSSNLDYNYSCIQ